MSANEALNALSTTHASNTPAGGDNIGTTLDDELRSNKGNIASAARWEVTATITAASTIPVTAMHKLVPCDGSAGGTVTLTLPTVANAGNGFDVDFIKIGAVNKVIIDGNGSEAVNGGTAVTLSAAYGRVRLACNGTKWFANHGAGESLTVNRTNYGFSVANGTDADHDLNIGAGQCWDSTYAELITYSAATIICDANWSGAGNLDTGSIPADDVLYLYVTHDASQANSIVVCSLSATWAGVTKQAGFTLGRRIGAVATDASNNIRGFTENAGEYFLHDRIQENADASTVSALWRNVTLPHAPVNSVGHIEYFMGRNGAASSITLYLAVTGAVNALTTAVWSNSTFGMYFRTIQSHIHVDSSQQIKVAEAHNGSSTIARTVYLLGWYFPNRFME